MSKELTLRCSHVMCELLANILRNYANAAYPKGGSECSQSARESLLVAADKLVAKWSDELQMTYINKRLRVMTKSAIQYYAQSLALEEDLPSGVRMKYLLSGLTGQVIDEAGYHAAQQKDRGA